MPVIFFNMQNMVVTVEGSRARYPLPPRLSDDIFSTKAKQQRITSFTSSGHEGKIADPGSSGPKRLWWHLWGLALALAPSRPGRGAGSSGASRDGQSCTSARLSILRVPGSETPVCPRLGKNLQASNTDFPVVFPSVRRSLV